MLVSSQRELTQFVLYTSLLFMMSRRLGGHRPMLHVSVGVFSANYVFEVAFCLIQLAFLLSSVIFLLSSEKGKSDLN